MTRTLAPIAFCTFALLTVACSKDSAPAPDTQTKSDTAKAPDAKPADAKSADAKSADAKPAASSSAAADAPSVPPLNVGDAAPDVDLPLENGKTVKLSSFKGKFVAVYFYPKDQTTGCTTEADGIRDSWTDIKSAGIEVIGVSSQDAASHKAFIEKEKLPYDLAVDTDGKIAAAFHVPSTSGYHARQTFLIGKDGKIAKTWLKVRPDGHAKEILAAAKS